MPSWLRIIENGAARLFAAGVQIIVLLVIARQLGPAGQGFLATATTWVALLASFAGLSLGQVCHERISAVKREHWLPSIAGTMLVVGLVSSAAAYALLYIATSLNEALRAMPPNVMALASLPLCLIVLEEYGRNLLAAAGLMRHYAIAQVAGGIVRLGLVAAAVGPLKWGILGALVGLSIGQAVTVLLQARAVLAAAGNRLHPNLAEARGFLSGALRLHANTVAGFLLGRGNVLLLHQFTSPRDVGWYQLATQGVMAFLLLPQAASMVIFAKVAEVGPDAAWPYQKRLMVHVLLVEVAAALLAAWAAPFVVVRIVGPEFEPAVPLFRWLLIVMLASSLAELMAPQWYARGAFLLSSGMTCLCAAINLGLNAVLIPRWGTTGAVLGTATCYLAFVVVAQVAFAFWCETRHTLKVANARAEPTRS